MRKHLNNLYVQYVLTAIFCFGFFCVPPHIFFCYLTHCVSWQFTFLDTCVSWHLCFLTLWVSGDKDLYIFFFLRLFFFSFLFHFFFSSLFISNYFSRTSYLYDSWLCIFFSFFFFFFSRQLICENTSITRIYINNRQIFVRFFFVYTAKHIFVSWNFVFLCIWRQSFEHLFFFSRRCISVFHGFFSFFFWTIFVGVFDISKFSACFSFFFFLVVFLLLRLVVTIHYFKLDHLKWEKNKQDGLRQRWSWSRHQN